MDVLLVKEMHVLSAIKMMGGIGMEIFVALKVNLLTVLVAVKLVRTSYQVARLVRMTVEKYLAQSVMIVRRVTSS
jgi:hypothetical protein